MRNSVKRKLARIQSIEAEYDEPLIDILTGFREQGCSWQTIEGVLEIAHSNLLQWRKDLGLKGDGRINVERRVAKSDRIARKMGYRDFRDLYRQMRDNGMTLRQISKRTGLSESTISSHAPEEMKHHWIVTPKMKKARLKNLEIGREKQIRERQLRKQGIG